MPQEIVMLHSALGLRPAVLEWAANLRAAGHHVHTPDIFDGEIFSTVEDGVRKRDALASTRSGASRAGNEAEEQRHPWRLLSEMVQTIESQAAEMSLSLSGHSAR